MHFGRYFLASLVFSFNIYGNQNCKDYVVVLTDSGLEVNLLNLRLFLI